MGGYEQQIGVEMRQLQLVGSDTMYCFVQRSKASLGLGAWAENVQPGSRSALHVHEGTLLAKWGPSEETTTHVVPRYKGSARKNSA